MKKPVLAAGCAVLLAGALALPAFAQNLAVVNGVPIPQSRLDDQMTQLEARAAQAGRPLPPGVKDQIKKQIIDLEIYSQEAKRLGLDNTPDFREQMELARQSILTNELVQDYTKKHSVTDEEAKTEYDNMVAKQRADAVGAKEYEIHHILIADDPKIKDKDKADADAKAKAESLIAQLKKGAKFEDLAKKYSKDPGSAAKGGDLGWSNPAGFVPEFGDAVKKLGKGQMTQEPVKTQFGYHIIRVDDVRDAKPPVMPKFDDVKAQLKQQLQQKETAKYMEDLHSKAKVE